MASTITVHEIDHGDKSWLQRGARRIAISMEELVRRLIRSAAAPPLRLWSVTRSELLQLDEVGVGQAQVRMDAREDDRVARVDDAAARQLRRERRGGQRGGIHQQR